MKNIDIILGESIKLMEQGKIGTTGRKIIMKNGNGETVEMPEPEPIHTYAGWKSLGRQVQRGEKCTAKFLIWKHTIKKAKTATEEDEEKMFMTPAAFFTISQTKECNHANKMN